MRRVLTFAAILAANASPVLASGSVEGRWLTDDGKGIVTVARCGASVCGRITRVLDSEPYVPSTDVNNPDGRLRSRPIVGLLVLYGFTFRDGKWSGGTAYDPKSGSSYRASLATGADGSLKLTGCVLFICKSKRWVRQT